MCAGRFGSVAICRAATAGRVPPAAVHKEEPSHQRMITLSIYFFVLDFDSPPSVVPEAARADPRSPATKAGT